MGYLLRRFLMPLAAIFAGVAGFALWLRFMAPKPLHGTLTGAGPRLTALPHGKRAPPLEGPDSLVAGVLLVCHVLAIVAGVTGVAGALVLLARVRGRHARARPGHVLAVELQLGRDDQASPYEVSKIFDGLAGVLRPGLVRRILIGPETLTLRIVSRPGAEAVRFTVVAQPRFHAAIAARLRATYPDTKLIPIRLADSDPLGLTDVVSPTAALSARLREQKVPEVDIAVLRLKKARRWIWALATTKDYEHSPIESLVSVMHAVPGPCVVELLLTPAPVLLDRCAGWALHRRERSYISEYGLSNAEPGVESVVAQKHLKGAVEGIGRAWWWFDYRVLVDCGLEGAARQVAGVVQETRAENYLRPRRCVSATVSMRGGLLVVFLSSIRRSGQAQYQVPRSRHSGTYQHSA